MASETGEELARRLRQCDDDAVAAYLLAHPDFLRRHSKVLAEVLATLATDVGAPGTVSLAEKRLAVLRDQSLRAEADRAALIETARTNESLSVCLHKLALELLSDVALDCGRLSCAGKATGVSRICRQVLTQRISGVHVLTHWFDSFLRRTDDTRLSIINEEDQRISSLVHSLCALHEPSCGPFSEPERIVLFGRFAASVRSAVVAPLLEPQTNSGMGLLVLTSGDAARFAPGKGTMFLVQLMQLMECVFTPARLQACDDR